jgi:hypothetical protein
MSQASNVVDREGQLCDVEPILFHDEPIPLKGGIDLERELDNLTIVQERMAKGMKLINKIDKRLAEAKAGDYLPKEQFMKLIEKKKQCWTLWNQLKEQAQAIANKHPSLWPNYFKLGEEELTPYFTYGDTEAVDSQEELKQMSGDIADELRDSHIEEQREFTRDFNEKPYLPRDWWNPKYERKLINEQLEFNSMVASLQGESF